MFFEERLESLKKHFSPHDFKVPFVNGSDILTAIEQRFIIYKDIAGDITNLAQYHSNWAVNVKSKTHILTVRADKLYESLLLLDGDSNYWVVLGDDHMAKHLVFDCKPIAIKALIAVARCNFFIVDKKYRWFSSFECNGPSGTIQIYKSGKSKVPFE